MQAGSFIGRQSSMPAATAIRSASNFGCSRSFVFGTNDNSNQSNPPAEQPGEGGGAGGSRLKPAGSVGSNPGAVASFAGLKGMIAGNQRSGSSKRPPSKGAGSARLFSLLGEGQQQQAADGSGVDLHLLHAAKCNPKGR